MIIYKKSMSCCLSLLGILACSNAFAANIYVDGGTIEAGASWDSTDGSSYTSGHGTGTGFSTVQAAVNAMNGGDDVFIRGGTYNEFATLSPLKNGSSSNWSTIQSYPGEWAVIDANAASHYVLGKNNYDKTRSSNMLSYWKFERLELTGGDDSGLFISGGPFIVRYIYFHDNLAPDGGANPAGIKGMIWKDSIVEYCYFKDNGTSGSANEQHSAIGIQIHSDYVYSDPAIGPADINNAYQKNVYQYNLFENTASRAQSGIHDKALQTLSPNTDIDWTYKEFGNKIHHNIFIGIERPIGSQQGFAQIHNNIAWNAKRGIHNADPGNGRAAQAMVIYNNTLFGGRIQANFSSATYTGWKNPYLYIFNNILDTAPPDDWRYDIFLGAEVVDSGLVYDTTKTNITGNYIYRPLNSNEIKNVTTVMSMSSYDATYSSTNFSGATSGLYQGTTGASKYITAGDHVMSGSTTIATGGIGGNHPYLSGATIPGYVGATNPDDNAWVAGVLDLANISTLQNGTQDDPQWIEGNGSTPFVIQAPAGFKFN